MSVGARSGDDAARIRARLSTPDDARALAESLGLLGGDGVRRAWERTGDGVLVRCPVHDDRGPSCHVSARAGGLVVYCHGCAARGSWLDLVAWVRGIDARAEFPRLLGEAAALCGVEGPTPARPSARDASPSADSDTSRDDVHGRVVELLRADGWGVGELAAREARGETLPPGIAEGLAYLRGRGLLHDAAREVRGWCLLPGSDGRSWRALMAVRDRLAGELGDEVWLSSGLAVREGPRRGLWTYPAHRLVIPWHRVDGSVAVVQRRAVAELSEGLPRYVMPPRRPPAAPWGWADLLEDGDDVAAIVEGAVDAVSFNALMRSQGATARAVGLPGVGGWRASWASLLASWVASQGGRRVVLALDPDEGGEGGCRRLRGDLAAVGVEVSEGDEWVPDGARDWGDAWRIEVTGAGA